MSKDRRDIDGGLSALGGFLYQTVGALGLKAGSFQDVQDTGIPELETLLGFAKTGQVSYEQFDQDTTIKHVLHGEKLHGYILVQFKYSTLLPPRDIEPAELQKIYSRLQASNVKAEGLGYMTTGYSLLTNRALSKKAQEKLDSEAFQGVPFHVAQSIPKDFWERLLRAFAQSYGCDDEEVDRGIREGIGLVMQEAGSRGTLVITKEALVKVFTGYEYTRPLTPTDVAQQSKGQLAHFSVQRFRPEYRQEFVRREILNEISRKAEDHAFVALYGGGGNGKTVALWHWMDESFASALAEQQGAYYALLPAEDVSAGCFPNLLCAWAGVPPSHRWHQLYKPEQILERLSIARQTSHTTAAHPILFLGLDALDEAFSEHDRPALKELLRWFWEQEESRIEHPPRATVVVTCRDKKDLEERRLQLSSAFGDLEAHVEGVEVTDFTDDELLAVARLGLPETLSARFERALHVTEGQSLAFTGGTQLALFPLYRDPAIQAVDEDVLVSLRHPALWRCLLVLGDQQTQSLVLDGHQVALGKLADRYLRWFCRKARERGHRLDEQELLNVISAVARACRKSASPKHGRKDWIAAASSTPYLTESQAERLFDEALSAGLIVRDDRDWWRWRHPFVGDHLTMWSQQEKAGL